MSDLHDNPSDALPESSVRTGLPYHQIHRGGAGGGGLGNWWRALAGALLLGAVVILVVPLVLVAAFTIGFFAAGEEAQAGLEQVTDTANATPLGLMFVYLVLISAIPAAWLVTRVLHGLRPRWLSSVAPRLRWRWFVVCFGLAFVALLATVVVSVLVPQEGGGTEISSELNDFTSTTRDFLLVVVLLTPLQAAAEEYAFRGYLTQAFGGIFGTVWVAVPVPALLFALAHGAQDPPIFFDRFAFGLVAGCLVIVTGGLEAAIAMHVLNNWLAFGIALAYGDMSSALNPTGGTWWSIPVTLTQSLVFFGHVVWVARRMGLRTTTHQDVLEASRGRV